MSRGEAIGTAGWGGEVGAGPGVSETTLILQQVSDTNEVQPIGKDKVKTLDMVHGNNEAMAIMKHMGYMLPTVHGDNVVEPITPIKTKVLTEVHETNEALFVFNGDVGPLYMLSRPPIIARVQ